MGFLAGYNEWGTRKGKYEHKIRADLRDGMVTSCALRTNDEERDVETSIVELWVRWRPFDVLIHRFEMEQWLNVCNFDFAAYRPLGVLSPRSNQNKPKRRIVAKTKKK